MARSNTASSGALDGWLNKGTTMTGDLVFEQPFRIDGVFKGTIKSDAQLAVGEGAEVEADIDVAVLLVQGRITGKIRASERVEIHPGGKVIGDIRAPNLITRQGAVFRGNCFIGDEEDADRPLHAERAFFKGAS